MKQVPTLEEATDDFFELHWNASRISDLRPRWKTWNLQGVPPEAGMGGCYAIYGGDRLLYIGVAVTEGKNATKTGKKYGLLNRLERHVIRRASEVPRSMFPLTGRNNGKT